MSPLQKADLVKLVQKEVDGAITLAIGDGANDVGMIQVIIFEITKSFTVVLVVRLFPVVSRFS